MWLKDRWPFWVSDKPIKSIFVPPVISKSVEKSITVSCLFRLPPRHVEPCVVCGYHPNRPSQFHAGAESDPGQRRDHRGGEEETRSQGKRKRHKIHNK
jgi:hypothetical protein